MSTKKGIDDLVVDPRYQAVENEFRKRSFSR